MKYRILIPTYKRARLMMDPNRRHTVDWFSKELLKKTSLALREEDADNYDPVLEKYEGLGSVILEEHPKNIVQTRDELLEYCYNFDYVITMDDDLKFAYKPYIDENTLDAKKYITMDEETSEEMVDDLIRHCDDLHPIVGITARQFSNEKTAVYEENTRLIQVTCIKSDVWAKEHIYYGDSGMEFASDYYFTLEWLARGYKNRVLNRYTRDDVAQAKGGCETYRTAEMHTESMKKLYKLFPEVVSLKWKNNGTWEEPRLNCSVRWKKAFDLYARRKQ